MKLDFEKGMDIMPYFSIILEKLELADGIAQFMENNDEQDTTKVGLDFILKNVLRNIKVVQDEIYAIVAIVEEKEIDDLKKGKIGFWKVVRVFKDIFQDEDLQDFFN